MCDLRGDGLSNIKVVHADRVKVLQEVKFKSTGGCQVRLTNAGSKGGQVAARVAITHKLTSDEICASYDKEGLTQLIEMLTNMRDSMADIPDSVPPGVRGLPKLTSMYAIDLPRDIQSITFEATGGAPMELKVEGEKLIIWTNVGCATQGQSSYDAQGISQLISLLSNIQPQVAANKGGQS